MKRIKFYSIADLSTGYYLEKIVELINNFDCIENEFNINDIIEFFNIIKYNEKDLLQKYCKQYGVKNFDETIKSFRKIIGQFINREKFNNFIKLYENVERIYKNDFWELIEYYKIYESISQDDFFAFLQSNTVYLSHILKNKKIVCHFGYILRQYMISDSNSAELLLNKYEIDHMTKRDDIFFPPSLTINDKENILRDYINSDRPNLNYLRIIVNVQSTSDLKVSDKIRLQAAKRKKIEEDKIFDTKSVLMTSTSVSFHENQEEAIIYDFDEENYECKISLKWLHENLDYPTLINNFIYLFEFVDNQMRLSLVSKTSELGIFERHLFIHSKKSYKIGIVFQQKDFLSKLQLYGYYYQLFKINIRLEGVIEWFFLSYIKDEFGIKDFRVKMPSENSSYLEKCRAILPEMDSILKQYRLFIDDGKVDHELLQMSSEHLFFRDCVSILEKKYIYANSDMYSRASFYFFSDQCMLAYIPRIEDKYTSFFDLIMNERVSINDYEEYQKVDLEWLIENKCIELDDTGLLNIKNITRILIFKDMYKNEVINYYRISEKYRKEIDTLLDQGIFRVENKFFSIPEQEYFDYYLNKATFNNALDLRNMYLHGTQPNNHSTDEIYKEHYMIFLRLFVIIVIKINDELCIWDEQKTTKAREEKNLLNISKVDSRT